MKFRSMLLLGSAVVSAGLVALTTDADARPRRGNRARHHFRSSRAPDRPRTPALANDSTPAPDSPVAGAAAEGSFRQDVIGGGTLLAMSQDRALLLSSYRGLSLVDTSDPGAPHILASVEVEGTGNRMLLGDGDVAVVSGGWDADGAYTLITGVGISDTGLAAKGSVRTDGYFVDGARAGADVLVVTSDGWYGPVYAVDANGNYTGGAPGVEKRRRHRHRHPQPRSFAAPSGGVDPGLAYPWYGGGGESHVARAQVAADGTPTLLGAVTFDGSVAAQSVTGTEAIVSVSGRPTGTGDIACTQSIPGTCYGAYADALLRVTDGPDGAPVVSADLALDQGAGPSALNRDGDTLRALSYGGTGPVVQTFDLAGGAITPLGSFATGTWPSAFAFSGGAFVYVTTDWRYAEPYLPGDPVFDVNGVADAMGGVAQSLSTLQCVDLRDPAHPAAGGSLDIGYGWIGGLVAVPGGVVGTTYDYAGDAASTSLFRADVTDPKAPTLAGTADVGGYANLGPVLPGLLLLNGGVVETNGSFRPTTTLVDLAGGGLAVGGSFTPRSWTAEAARSGDLLGLAGYDRLTLVRIGDLENPQIAGEVRLVVNVAGFAALSDSVGAALTTDYLGGDVEIRSVSLPDADALAPLDVLKVGTGDAQLFASAPFLYVVATDWTTGRAAVHVVDASDPAHLVLRGSLDLASYPGQIFQKGDALLLLREAYTLFTENEDGVTKPDPDAFGRCPRSWLRDDLTAVLDVVDLRDPDAPTAAERLRLRWDWSGSAVLSGDSLYVSAYVDLTQPDDQFATYAYRVREIDVTDPTNPTAGPAVDVPGTLVAAAGAPHRILTADYSWSDTTGETTSTLRLVDLSREWRERVVGSAEIRGYPDTVTTSAGHAYVVAETWIAYAAESPAKLADPSAKLYAFDITGDAMTETAKLVRDSGAFGGEVAGGCLFLRTWGWTGALDVYSLADPAVPAFAATHEVVGLAGGVTVVGGRAYVAGGPYGVRSFELGK
jgi:hypothetical protein